MVFFMLVYSVQSVPDLTLGKYQAFAEAGVNGMLEVQTQFVRQLQRIALLGNLGIHFVFDYSPERPAGNKLNIEFIFSGESGDYTYYEKIKKFIRSTNLSSYFCIEEKKEKDAEQSFSYMSVARKKERFLQTSINGEEQYFYLVSNWEMNDTARLYNILKMMQAFDEKCCYRVDLYPEKNLEEEIHKNFERPLSYLRNISRKDKGISEYSKIVQEKNDPNAEETLRQYESWLKSVDASPIFRCRVCVMTEDEQYGQLLLDSAATESLKTGNVSINIKEQGKFSKYSFLNALPDDEYLEGTPNSMKKWATTYTAEEIAAFIRFPVLYDGENIELPKETAATNQGEGIVLGKNNNGYPVHIPLELFPKHMFVCGVPGAGKTNTMLHIANSLWNHEIQGKDGKRKKVNIPFLVLEPAKREYRELAYFDIPELIIFSPSACTNFPMRINPFEFAKGLTLSEHINRLCQVFEGAFPIAPPAPFILDRAIQAIYEKHGWNVKEVNCGVKEYPVMSELYDQFEKELLTTSYDSEIQGNIRSVLEMRIGSLLRREMKEIFDVQKSSLSPEEWMKYPIIIELEALGEGPANFVTLLLCNLIRETLKVSPMENKERPVRHVIFIEEAHNLIAPEAQVKDGQDSNPKVAATAFIVKMLAEVRALREGIIIADQLPTAMAPEVIKNTNIKLVHRLTSGDDRELVGSTMSATSLQMESMATYTSGQALYTYEKLLRPFEMRVSLVEEHGVNTPNDAELYEKMLTKPKFRSILQQEEEDKWSRLKEKVENLNESERKAIRAITNLDIQKYQYKELDQKVEFFGEKLQGIRLMKKRLLLECSQISLDFIASERKDALAEIIKNIGNRYAKKLENFIMYL